MRHIDDTPGVPCINDDDEAWNSVSLRGCQTSNETPSSETPLWYLVARYTMIPASIYEGFTGSILWVAQVGHLPLLQCKLLIFLLLGFGLVCVVFNFRI